MCIFSWDNFRHRVQRCFGFVEAYIFSLLEKIKLNQVLVDSN